MRILLFFFLSSCLYGQAPAISGKLVDAVTKTSSRITWTAGHYHDTATDVTLTTGFTSGFGGSGAQTIEVSSTSNFFGNTHDPPSSFIINGSEWGRVVTVVDGTHISVGMNQSVENGGEGGTGLSESFHESRSGVSFTCSSGTCTVTVNYPLPVWWNTGLLFWLGGSIAPGINRYLGGVHYSVGTRIDSTHYSFAVTCSPGCDGTWNYANGDTDFLFETAYGQVHSPGETISLTNSDGVVCYGDPGGSSGVYPHQMRWNTSTFNPSAQANIHYVYLFGMTPGSTIHYIVASTPAQFGPTNCASIGAHTGVSADDTIVFPSSESTDPTPPSGVTFSTALPGSYADSKLVGTDCANLQACIDTAASTAGKHELRVPEGTTTTAPSGAYILRPLTSGSLEITIRSSASDGQLPAQGLCVPQMVDGTPSPCINNATYTSHLATIQNASAGAKIFVLQDLAKIEHYHIGPGLMLRSNVNNDPAPLNPLIDLSHFRGTGLMGHQYHVNDFIVDRVYFYQKNISNSANGAIFIQGGTSFAVVDCVMEGFANRDNDQAGIQITGADASDGGFIISNNRIEAASMPLYLAGEGWNTSNGIIRRNWMHFSKKWNLIDPSFPFQVTLPVVSTSEGNPSTTITTGEPTEFDKYAGFNRPVLFQGATGSWTPLNVKTFTQADDTLSDFNCSSGLCIATTGSPHGLVSNQYVVVAGLGNPPFGCVNENGGHQIAVTDTTHFQYASGTTGHCIWPKVTIYGPAFPPANTGNNKVFTIPLNSVGFGALTGTVTANYGTFVDTKNTSEFKNGRFWEISGNVFENSISHEQNGTGFALTNRQAGGYQDVSNFAPTSTISDVWFHDNWFHSVGMGMSFLGIQDNGASVPITKIKRTNNLVTDVWNGQCPESCASVNVMLGNGTYIVDNHNTYLATISTSYGAAIKPPPNGDWTFTNNITLFGSTGLFDTSYGGGTYIGGQLHMTSGSCTEGPCNIANPPYPNTLIYSKNAFIGENCFSNSGCGGGDPWGFNRRYYDGFTSGDITTDYQGNFWPTSYAGVSFTGATAITGASNTSPIVVTTNTMSCVPDPGDRVQALGIGGNTAAVGTWYVKASSPTSLTFLGSVGSGTFTSGGRVIPVTGACAGPAVWALSGSSNYKAGTSFVAPASDLTTAGQGDASDGTNLGVDITSLMNNIAGCSMSPASLPNATLTQSYNQTVSQGGCSSSTFTISSGTLTGSCLSLNSSSGAITGTVCGPSSHTYNFTVSYDTASTAYSILVSPVPAITEGALPHATQGVGYSQTLCPTSCGGTGAVTCALTSGSLAGSGISIVGCTLTGTGGTPATYTGNITPTDANGISGSPYAMTLVVDASGGCTLSPPTLPGATVSQAYSQTVSHGGSCSSSTFTISSGTLTGSCLSLNSSSGAITGTACGPAPHTYNFTVSYDTASQAYSLLMSAAPPGTTMQNVTIVGSPTIR